MKRQVWLNVDGEGRVKLIGSTGVDFSLPNSIVDPRLIQQVTARLEKYLAGDTGAC